MKTLRKGVQEYLSLRRSLGASYRGFNDPLTKAYKSAHRRGYVGLACGAFRDVTVRE